MSKNNKINYTERQQNREDTKYDCWNNTYIANDLRWEPAPKGKTKEIRTINSLKNRIENCAYPPRLKKLNKKLSAFKITNPELFV